MTDLHELVTLWRNEAKTDDALDGRESLYYCADLLERALTVRAVKFSTGPCSCGERYVVAYTVGQPFAPMCRDCWSAVQAAVHALGNSA